MALKELIAQSSSLTEDAIEEIVAAYVRYDPDEATVAFTPAAATLQNRAKVLVYLVALQGWPFVIDKTVSIDAKPAEIGKHVGIQGGSLRPILKELKDRHIIAEKSGRYFVRPVTLSTIKAQLGGSEGQPSTPKLPSRRRRKSKIAQSPKDDVGLENKKTGRRDTGAKTGNLAARFNKWIDDGFFDQPKTLSDVQKRFHKEGLIVARTSVPTYLLKAVRKGRLTREEVDVNKRTVWVYRSNKE